MSGVQADTRPGHQSSDPGQWSRGSDLLRPVTIELRAPYLAYGFPVLLGLGVWAAFQGLIEGVSYWPNGIMAVNASVQLLGPLLAGIAAFLATREHRRKLQAVRLLTTRPAWAFPAAELATIVGLAVAVHIGVALIIGGYLLATGAVGPISTAMILSGVVSAAFHPVLGYLIGRALPRIYVPPLVAIGTYLIALVAMSQSGQPWYLLSPVLNELVDPFGGPRAELYWRHSLWLVGATALLAVVAALLTDRRWRVATALVAPTALTVTGAVLVAELGGAYYARDIPPFDYVCADEQVTICVHPAFQDALPGLQARFSPLAERLADSPAAFSRLQQRPRGIGSEPEPGAQAIHLDRISPAALDDAVLEYVEQRVDFNACVDQGEVGLRHTRIVLIWLLDPEAPPVADPAGASQFLAGLNSQESRVWLREHYQEFITCQLEAADFQAASSAA